jgi:hypothetical protein
MYGFGNSLAFVPNMYPSNLGEMNLYQPTLYQPTLYHPTGQILPILSVSYQPQQVYCMQREPQYVCTSRNVPVLLTQTNKTICKCGRPLSENDRRCYMCCSKKANKNQSFRQMSTNQSALKHASPNPIQGCYPICRKCNSVINPNIGCYCS